MESWEEPQLIGANRTQIRVRGKARVTLTMAENNFSTMVIIVDALTAEAILGLEFLEKHECTCTCTYHPYGKTVTAVLPPRSNSACCSISNDTEGQGDAA